MNCFTKAFDIMYTIVKGRPNIKLLKKMGLKIGNNVNIQKGVIIDQSHCWLIEIGNNVVLAPNVHILAHDASTKFHIGYTKIGKVKIEDNVFVGAGTIILPNVNIGKNSIIGCNSVVTSDVPENTVFAGCPAKKIQDLDKYLEKFTNIDEKLKFGEEYTLRGKIDFAKKEEMSKALEGKIGLVK